MQSVLGMLKSENRLVRMEGYFILVLILGAVMLSAGIGLSAWAQKGLPALLAMFGSLVAFIATIGLVLTWLVVEIKGE